MKGVSIVLKKTGRLICPVQALVDYLLVRPNREGALFLQEDGSKDQIKEAVRTALLQTGLSPDLFAGHSFRIGAATTAAAAGVPAHIIKFMERWSSDAYLLYVRADTDRQCLVWLPHCLSASHANLLTQSSYPHSLNALPLSLSTNLSNLSCIIVSHLALYIYTILVCVFHIML